VIANGAGGNKAAADAGGRPEPAPGRFGFSLAIAWVAWTIPGALATVAGCLTTPPPVISTPPPSRPTILVDGVLPPPGQPLLAWPPGGYFTVPVALEDPTEGFLYDVFVDYSIESNTSTNPQPTLYPVSVTPSGSDGGVVGVVFQLGSQELGLPFPPTSCLTIQFLVVHGFAVLEGGATLYHVPDDVGSDSVTWFYTPGGGLNGCAVYDAGIYEDGATPSDSPAGEPSDAEEEP